MAVSMNAGFMRSDYMISDAAIPMRMEELEQLEQSAKFSEILGEIGDAPAEEAQVMQENTLESSPVSEKENAVTEVTEDIGTVTESSNEKAVLTKAELKDLARRVVRGELKLSEIPEELKTDVLLMVIAMMLMGIPEEEIPELQDAPDGEISAAVRAVEPTAEKSDKTPELNELLLKFAKTQQDAEEIEASSEIDAGMPTQPEDIVSTLVGEKTSVISDEKDSSVSVAKENVRPGEAEADVTQQVSTDTEITGDAFADTQSVNSNAAEQVKATTAADEKVQQIKPDTKIAPVQHTNNTAENTAVVQNASGEHSSNGQQNGTFSKDGSAAAVMTNAKAKTDNSDGINIEFRELRSIVSDVTVKTTEPQSQANAQSTAEVSYMPNDMQRSRLVSKSDELNMLKNAAIPTADKNVKELNTPAQSVPQTAISDIPVVFTRSDGTEISVKPAEVLEQVTAGIIEQAENVTEGRTEYSITLTPEDLGSITVKLTKAADGALTVSIAADNARTQRLLEESGLAIQNSLRQNGIELESWQTVNESQQETRAQDYQGSSKNPYYQEENDSENGDADDNSFAELISAM